MRRASTKGRSLLDAAAAYATRYLAGLTTRPVAPTGEALERLATLDRPFPQSPADPRSRCAGCWTPSACRAAVRAGS